MVHVQVLLGKLEGKRPLGRTRCRWEENIKMDFQEVRWGWGLDQIDRIGSGGGALVNAARNLWVP